MGIPGVTNIWNAIQEHGVKDRFLVTIYILRTGITAKLFKM